MSDTDCDNFKRKREVDKVEFLNSVFSEPVLDISPDCLTDFFLFPEVIPAMGGSEWTLFIACSKSESNPARNHWLVSQVY